MVGGAVLGLALGTGVVRVPCWFRLLTGLDCPFCGGSRALGALLEGDLAGAIDYNLFAVVVMVPLAVVLVGVLALWETGHAIRWPRARIRGAVVGLVGLVLVWWVLRDLPVSALEWLRA
ncbi:Protein of unknown function (DUF2752) [Saccharomonospora glauca K62]|uniref:DUF2752 domain-containing protein n=1 Tax=Saccharomonospora glauca K62 TaxID=928724 RepID=I1D0D7_9PSEU|nr:Protein of unknown function (DUF2752) [Saccharomonospora glauca K62]